MAVTTRSLSAIRTEFGDTPDNDALSEYVRGGNVVRNHDNNAAISSSVGGLAISQFLNSDKDFDSINGTNSGRWSSYSSIIDLGSFQGTPSRQYEVIAGYRQPGTSFSPHMVNTLTVGSRNNFYRMGAYGGGLSQVQVIAAFDYGYSYDDPFSVFTSDFVLAVEGNWYPGQGGNSPSWSSVKITTYGEFGGVVTFYMPGYGSPSPSQIFYNSGADYTYWIWGGTANIVAATAIGFDVSDTFRIELTF
jgi:hypothetical protein